ncbi:MAG: sensor histidine kinase [Minisyncoccota bacterium]
MSLGTKINLMITAVTIVVLSVAFGLIVSIEASSIKNQALQDSATVADMLKDNIEGMFQEVYDQQRSLQSIVDKVSSVEGVKYIKVTGVDGYHIAATDHNEVGKKVVDKDAELVRRAINERREIDVQNDETTFFDLERYIPIRRYEQESSSGIIAVIEVEVSTRSKNASDIRSAQKILQTISASVEQGTRSIIATRESDFETIQKTTDEIKRFDFFHDVIVFDSKLNLIANTNLEGDELKDDSPEFKQYREDVLFGKTREASYRRFHEDQEVLVRVLPIEMVAGDTTSIEGILEVHIRTAYYEDKIMAFLLRMTGIGILFTGTLIIALAFILRREVVEPLKKYSQVAQKVSEGDFDQKIDHISKDEIGRFGEVFNSMVANLREIDRLKTDFLTVAAHQLRTPLSSVKWALKLLLDSEVGPINEDQRSMLKRGYETNEKIIELVNDLLNVSRIESGKSTYKFEVNDFVKLFDTLAQNSSLTAEAHGVKVRFEKETEIPAFVFDYEKISIAFQNLVDNAIKYTLPGGNVTITAGKKGDYLEVKVSDTGVGIPQSELPKLFSKFFRATNVIHLQTEGTGLGLVIVKSIIVRHGGRVWVDSVEGQGTTFTVMLPLLAELIPKEDAMGAGQGEVAKEERVG